MRTNDPPDSQELRRLSGGFRSLAVFERRHAG
jgi:hypothetical protein